MAIKNNYNWISYQDLKEILSEEDIGFLDEYIYETSSVLDQIEQVCKLYEKLFEEAEISFIKKEGRSTFDKYYIDSPFEKKAEQIVYRLRSFLLQEDIKVQEMMFQTIDKKSTPVGTYEKNMVDLLLDKEIKINLNQGIINLNKTLTQVGVENLKKEHLEKWNKILNYSGIEKEEEFEPIKGDTFSYKGKIYQRFRHRVDSKKMVFTGDPDNKSSIKYYYMKNYDSDYMYVNRGNIFEWFEDVVSNYSESTIRSLGISNLFEKIMESHATEGIAGYKQGDYYSKKEQQWVQAKYGNHTLGQIRDIHRVIVSSKKTKGILEIIKDYKTQLNINKNRANKEIQNDFLKLFTTSQDDIDRNISDKLGIDKYLKDKKQNKIIINLGLKD